MKEAESSTKKLVVRQREISVEGKEKVHGEVHEQYYTKEGEKD